MRDIYYEQLLEYNKTYKDVDELYTNYEVFTILNNEFLKIR